MVAATETFRIPLLGIPRGVVLAVGGFAAVPWIATTAAGVVFGWLCVEARIRSRLWAGSGVVGRLWHWEAHQWWKASLAAIAIGTLAAPVFFALSDAPAQGAPIVAMIVAATLLSWVIDVCGVDGRVLALEVIVSLPVMFASIGMREPNAVVVLMLGVAAPVVLAAVVSR